MPEQDATLLARNIAKKVGITDLSTLNEGEMRDALTFAELIVDARHTGNGANAQKRRKDLDALLKKAATRIAEEAAKKSATAGSTK